MYKVKYLTTKQSQIIEDLFTGNIEFEDVLKKHGISQRTYCRWLEQENFALEYKRRLKLSEHLKELILARYTPSAASGVARLTVAQKEETARKACMDIINHPDIKAKIQSQIKKPPEKEEQDPLPDLEPEVVSKLLTVLAESSKLESD